MAFTRRDIVIAAAGGLAAAALVGGTASAAHRFLLSSGSQIKPGVIQLKHLSKQTQRALRVPGPAGAAGVRGSTGAAGPAGVAGSPGTRGPSDGYYASQVGFVDLNTPSPNAHTLVQLQLPAGDYIVTATATIRNYDTTHTVYAPSCGLDGATPLTNALSDVSVAPASSGSVGGKSAAAITTAVHLTAAATLVFECSGDSDSSDLDATDGNLTAIQVGQLHPVP
jgi:hypothetical protein